MGLTFNGGGNIRYSSLGYEPAMGSVAFWMRSTQTDGNGSMYSHNTTDASRGGFMFLFNNGGNGKVAVYQKQDNGAESVVLRSTAALNDGLWHHVAARWTKGDQQPVELWVDGVKDGQALTVGFTRVASNADVVVGRAVDGFWAPFKGDMAELVEIVDRWFTDDEIVAMAKGIIPPIALSGLPFRPYLYVPMNEDGRSLFRATYYTQGGFTKGPHPRTFR